MRAIEFANLPAIESAAQVEALFAGIKSPYFKTIRHEDPEGRAYRDNDQPRLRLWLARLERGQTERARVAREVNAFMHKVPVRFYLDARGRKRHEYVIDGVEAAIAITMFLFLAEEHGLTGRVRQCGWTECGRFNFNPNPSSGRPRRHCPGTDHDRRADNERSRDRVDRWRAAEKKRRAAEERATRKATR